MKTTKFWLAALLLVAPLAVAEEPADTFQLIYPMSAASEESLDATTPANRITPPVREEAEVDPVTPLGQIRGVITSLDEIKKATADLKERINGLDHEALAALPTKKDFDGLLPLLERGAEQTGEIETNVESLVQSNRLIGGRIEEIAKTTADLRATVESAQQTIASIERIRTSRWTDYAVLAILGLAVLQLLSKTGGFLVMRIKAFFKRLEDLTKANDLAQQLLNAADSQSQRPGATKENN